MNDLKNSTGSRDQQDMHNIEDARVKVHTAPDPVPPRKGVVWLKKAAKFAAHIGLRQFSIYLMENADSIWDSLFSNVEALLEVLS